MQRKPMGRVLRMRPCSLQRVWAVAEVAAQPASKAEQVSQSPRLVRQRCRTQPARKAGPTPDTRRAEVPASRPAVDLGFYRKYTEAMLRRYMRLSMEAGRVPSLLGREMFRGNVTSYRVHSFEDVVLFCIDVERCLAKLNAGEQDLIRRIALQQYSNGEAAALMGRSLRSVFVGYSGAVDHVTELFMARGMMEALKSCQ